MVVEEDPDPSSDKITRVPDGWVLFNLTGVRTVIKKRQGGTGYDITKGDVPLVCGARSITGHCSWAILD